MKTKFYILIFFLLPWALNSFSQDCVEFKKHLKSIASTYYPGHILDRMDTVFNANRAFVDYTIENLLDKPSDKCFISNRNLLKKLIITSCDSSKVIMLDTLKNGETCKITITTSKFELKKHLIITNKDSSSIKKIDEDFPFGAEFGIPEIEIGQIRIEINGVNIKIPNKSYGNLYNPMLCTNYSFVRSIEAYESLNGDYIYLYVYGGNAADTYFAKLIFDKNKFITKIVCDYYPLSIHSSFRKGFLGF